MSALTGYLLNGHSQHFLRLGASPRVHAVCMQQVVRGHLTFNIFAAALMSA